METYRRRFLHSVALAASAASAGCLQGGEADSENGDDEPTSTVTENPRVDEPPYDIEEQPDDEEEWNEQYLCEHMSGDSDLEFQPVSAPRLTDSLLTDDHDGEEYAVRALTSAEAVREVFEVGESEGGGEGDGEPEEPIDRIDFDENVVLVVESGYGSGAVRHHWERVEVTDRGFRLYGCYMIPYIRTMDVTSRHSVVQVERPNDFEFARVSLTVDSERRVHVNSTEGVVSVDPEE